MRLVHAPSDCLCLESQSNPLLSLDTRTANASSAHYLQCFPEGADLFLRASGSKAISPGRARLYQPPPGTGTWLAKLQPLPGRCCLSPGSLPSVLTRSQQQHSQNHRVHQVGRDSSRSSCPTPLHFCGTALQKGLQGEVALSSPGGDSGLRPHRNVCF